MMKKIIFILCLLFVSNAIFADSSGTASVAVHPIADGTDISMAYLSMIFGQVGDSLSNVSGNMMGLLFFKFNQGVVIVAVAMLMYNSVHSATHMSIEGTVNSQQRNMAMMALRVTLGFSFLLPIHNSYNLIQHLLIRVVTESVHVANTAWISALDYLYSGGAVFISPDTTHSAGAGMLGAQYKKNLYDSGVGSGEFSDIKKNISKLSATSKIIAAEICMYNAQTTSPDSYTYLQPQEGTSEITFPQGCGSVNYAKLMGGHGLPLQQRMAASSLVSTLLTASQYLYCQADFSTIYPDKQAKKAKRFCSGFIDPAGVSPAPSIANISSAMVSGFLGYSSDVEPVLSAAVGASDKSKVDFIPNLETHGWVVAGSYYWSLISIQQAALGAQTWSTYIDAGGVTFTPPADDHSSFYKIMSKKVDDNFVASQSQATTGITNALGAADAGAPKSGSAQQANVGSMVASSALASVPIIGPLFSIASGFAAMENTIDPDSGAGNQNPVWMLHSLGLKCIDMAGNLFFGMLVSTVLMSLLVMVCPGQLNLFQPVMVMVRWLSPVVILLAGALIGVGLFLGYYVPIYPALIWMFGVLGWLIAVIEGMVAMPLVMLGVTHPEGHDLLGKSEQATMLGLGLFIRPIGMIVGFVAAMILSFVAYRMCIYSFGSLLNNLFGGTGGSGLIAGMSHYTSAMTASTSDLYSKLMLQIVSVPCLLIIFASLVWIIMEQCFGLISSVPDGLLNWIGGPNLSSMVNPVQMAKQIGGTVQSSGSQIGKGMGETMKSSAQALQKGFKGKLEGQREEEQRDRDRKERAEERKRERELDNGGGNDGGTGGGNGGV